MQIRPTKTFTVTDPREFDGDAYQVAERAIQQLEAIAGILVQAIDPAILMARNAELERQLANGITGEDLRTSAQEYGESPQGRQFAAIKECLSQTQARLLSLEKAAAFNPKAR